MDDKKSYSFRSQQQSKPIYSFFLNKRSDVNNNDRWNNSQKSEISTFTNSNKKETSNVFTNGYPKLRTFNGSSFMNRARLNHVETNNNNSLHEHLVNFKADENKKSIKLRYLINGATFSDTLHRQACPMMLCNTQKCTSSMLPYTNDKIKSKDVVLKEALEFIDDFYTATKKYNSVAHLKRKLEIRDKIEKKNTYDLTGEELVYGAKAAWRNASRCIGRIQWSNLQVFDERSARTPLEVFEAICNHLRYSTNNGNIRSTITIFRQRTESNKDFRIWNKQFIGYAGYEIDDKTIIGDKSNVELTKICQKFGWKGKGTEYDVLPIIIQVNGEEPSLFELPSDLILEVNITSPNYPSISDLHLKWYCVPAICNMLLDIGGLQFTTCPFNGWYMCTEIGRDLADINRYNKLHLVAEKMGLDTRSNKTLWKDQALVELNLAILYSFQKSSVTIIDHHSASESFLKHYENEKQARGGCPADWVWIVPPMSSHLTPVFHLEMINYCLKPSYEYQEDPWKSNHLKKSIFNDISNKTIKPKLKLGSVIRSIMFAQYIMKRIEAKRTKCTILYATETGKSQEFAKMLGNRFRQAFNIKVQCMCDYECKNLVNESLVLIVASTFGNGDSPENGKSFLKFLQNIGNEKSSNARNKNSWESYSLDSVQYSVFALGNSSYPCFCAFGKHLDTLFSDLKAKRLYIIGLGDELNEQEESFNVWSEGVFKSAINSFKIKYDFHVNENNKAYEKSSILSRMCAYISKNGAYKITELLADVHNKNVFLCKIKGKKNLESENSGRSTIKISLDMETDLASFEPGDHIGLFAKNRNEIVNTVFNSIDMNSLEELKIENLNNEDIKNSLIDSLTYFCDLTTPPTQKFLSYLTSAAQLKEHQNHLNKLSYDINEYKRWKYKKNPHLAEIIQEFPSIKFNANSLIIQLPKLQPRYYSISSSPKLIKDQIDLTVKIVEYMPKSGKQGMHYGVCSKWLDEITPDENICAFLKKTPSFKLPEDRTLPVIMIGAGSGIAPFRGFWQERAFIKENSQKKFPNGKNGNIWGDMSLYYGCRNRKHDQLYADEINEAIKNNVITSYYVAYSREPKEKKVYVQQLLKEHSMSLCEAIFDKNAHIYICGNAKMAADVSEAIIDIFKTEANMSHEKAHKCLEDLKISSRLHIDVFGTSSSLMEQEFKS